MCVKKDRGRVGKRTKTGHRAWEPQRGCCVANVRLSKSMRAEWWRINLHNGFNQSFLNVTVVFGIVAAL